MLKLFYLFAAVYLPIALYFTDTCRVVEFASRRDMERAIDKFDDYDLNGRRLKVR